MSMIHPTILRSTALLLEANKKSAVDADEDTSPMAMFSALPAQRTPVRLRGLLKCVLSDGRLMPIRPYRA